MRQLYVHRVTQVTYARVDMEDVDGPMHATKLIFWIKGSTPFVMTMHHDNVTQYADIYTSLTKAEIDEEIDATSHLGVMNGSLHHVGRLDCVPEKWGMDFTATMFDEDSVMIDKFTVHALLSSEEV